MSDMKRRPVKHPVLPDDKFKPRNEPTNDEIADYLLTADDRLFDAIDWHLTLYENGDVGYDQTIRNIIASFESCGMSWLAAIGRVLYWFRLIR